MISVGIGQSIDSVVHFDPSMVNVVRQENGTLFYNKKTVAVDSSLFSPSIAGKLSHPK